MIDYFDAYLAPLIDKTPDYETRAAADVAQLGTFPAPWPDKLTVLRAYILCCLESAASAEDVFSLKLKQYQSEWKDTLDQAKAAVTVIAERPTYPLSISIERA